MINNYIDYIYIYIKINYFEIQIIITNYYDYIYIYIYMYGAQHSLIALNIENICASAFFCLELFDFNTCNDFSVNIKFP